MKFRAIITAGALALVACGFAAEAVVQNEILVKFKTGLPSSLPAGYSLVRYHSGIKVAQIRMSAVNVTTAINTFKRRTDVSYAEPNYIRQWHRTVNDPLVPQQYALTKIKAFQAWDLYTGAPTTVVAVLDSGFDMNHEDMASKFVAGFDFMDNDTNPQWVSEPHGVETSSCVAAATDNNKGVAAIGFNCMVMPLRVGNTGIPTANSVAGMMWAADHGAKVINMSYGGPSQSQAEKDATDYAWNHGLVVVASAGNSGDNGNPISYPAAYPHVISVGATDSNDQRAGFSEFGPWVSVAAPGVQVMCNQPNNTYGKADGTSFSSPIVAGLAGLLFSFAPNGTTNLEIRNAIETTTDNVGTWLANGRVNAQRAMQVFDIATNVIENPATSVSPSIGGYVNGDVVSLSASDSDFYQMSTVSQSAGQVAAAEITVPVSTSTNLRKAWIEMEANGVVGSTGMIYAWNNNTSGWQLIKSVPLNSVGTGHSTIDLPTNISPYLASGSMRIMVRALNPKRPFSSAPAAPFTLNVGYVNVKVIQNN